MGHSEIKLKDITTKIGSGATPRGGKRAYKNDGISLVRSLNVYDFEFDYKNLAFIDDKQASELDNVKLQKKDILLNITGASVARCCMVPENILPGRVNQHVSIIRVNGSTANPRYVLFCLNSSTYKQKLLGMAHGGATREALTKTTIENFKIAFPTLDVQHKIASVLSAYDDLIENNNRRIKILEEMAQTIYDEWFIKFRFPGYSKVKMVDSELGNIPEGWDIKVVKQILTDYIGGGWGSDKKDDEHPISAYVIRGTDIPLVKYMSIQNCPFRFHKESNFKTRKIEAENIIMEVSGGSKDQAVGRAMLVSIRLLDLFGDNVICASFCKRLQVNNEIILPALLAFHIDEIYKNKKIEQYQTQSTGIKNFKFEVFLEKEKIALPPRQMQARFIESIQPMFEIKDILGIKNHFLRQSRDLLLPRLISGDLDVEKLDIAIEES